jgi:hypothetical protein
MPDTRCPESLPLTRALPGPPTQPRESESHGSYLAGRNATWSTKATPGAWNE